MEKIGDSNLSGVSLASSRSLGLPTSGPRRSRLSGSILSNPETSTSPLNFSRHHLQFRCFSCVPALKAWPLLRIRCSLIRISGSFFLG